MLSLDFHIYGFYCHEERIRLNNLVNLMLETSGEDSNKNGVAFEELLREGYTWVISKWKLEIERPIMQDEKISIKTWPSSFRKIYAFREYRVSDERGNIVAKATAVFVLVDLKDKKSALIPNEVVSRYNLINQKNFNKIERIVKSEKIFIIDEFKIRPTDIDINGHVNNSVYLDWIENAINRNKTNLFINELNMVYKKEIRNKDTVFIKADSDFNYMEVSTDFVNTEINLKLKNLEQLSF